MIAKTGLAPRSQRPAEAVTPGAPVLCVLCSLLPPVDPQASGRRLLMRGKTRRVFASKIFRLSASLMAAAST